MPLLDLLKSTTERNKAWWRCSLVLLGIITGTWLMSQIIPAESRRAWLQPHPETSYKVRVHIGRLNFGSFKQIILAGDDLLAHLPYSFNALNSPHKTSGWPSLLLSLNHPGASNHPHIATIPRHKHLYLQRHTISHQGMYAQLKPISENHQTPQQIDLVLIKITTNMKNKLGEEGDAPSSIQVAKISLFSSIPFTWSVESTDAAMGHFNEYAHISYQSLAQSSASQPWWTSP